MTQGEAILFIVVCVAIFVGCIGMMLYTYCYARKKKPELYAKLTTPPGGKRKSKFQQEREMVLKTRYKR